MELYEVIKKRKSIREYKTVNVESDKLKRMLNAARLAPSAKNIQPWKIIVVSDSKLKDKIANASYKQEHLARAPYVIVMCVNEKECYQEHGGYMSSFAVDGAIFMDHLTLSACNEGLGTCWIAKFSEAKIKKILNVPEPYRIVAMTPLGYPDEKGRDKERKPLSEIIYKNVWGKQLETEGS
jgi:nitroreductase